MLRTAILVTFFLSIHCASFTQSKRLFDFNEGLSNSLINQVLQDQQGFIWVATENGLNRFDGIKFVVFRHEKNNTASLKANFTTSMKVDRNGRLWVGLVNGLQVYEHETESFEEIEFYIVNERIHPYISSIIESSSGDIWVSTSGYGIFKVDQKSKQARWLNNPNGKLGSLYLRCIYPDRDHILWLGSDNNGLSSYNESTGEIKVYKQSGSDGAEIPNNEISAICEDHKGNIYIGSIEGGLFRLNKKTGKFERIIQSRTISSNLLPVKSLLFDSQQRLWVGTDGYGLYMLNPKTDQLENYALGNTSFDFAKSKIHSIIEDNAKNIWLGIFQKGLYLIPESPEIFKHYGYRAFSENSIGSSCVTAIDGERNNLWVGTDGDGVFYVERETQKVKHVFLKDSTNAFEGNNVLSLYNTGGDFLWIGTFSNGLVRYNKTDGAIKFFRNNPKEKNSLVNNKVTVIKNLNGNELLIGTLGGGVCRFDVDSGIFYTDSLYNDIPKNVNDIYIDKDEDVWIGTYNGLMRVDVNTKKLKTFTKTNGLLSDNLVYCIRGDSEGNIWVGTYNGLVKIDPVTNNSTFFFQENGLGSNTICSISEDEFGELWVSTHNGLSRLNLKHGNSFITYYAFDGLQSNEFSRNAAYCSEQEVLFFGGISGVTEVKKDYRNYVRKVRDVMLTDFIRFDEHVKIGDFSGKHIALKKSIVLADTVRLAEQDNVFSIGFTSTELANQSRITYEYKMEGFDKDWNVSNSRNRMATYTNLPHGTYNFLVRGGDKGQYSKARKLTIIIYPRWFKTVWAKILWFVLGGILFYGVILFYREKVKRKQTEKLTEMKMQFFINISHEIKTPLTLIIDPLEKLLIKKVDAPTRRLYDTMHRNASRIFRLVNQLLDVRKIDKGQLLFKYQKTNLYLFVKEVAGSYEYLAANKNINFKITSQDNDIVVWIDPLNFEKVILNLLSNAFKFTPNGGEVELIIAKIPGSKSQKEEVAKIVVADNGIGLKRSELEKIFNRFYQVYSKDRKGNTGTGIGLHLSRSLVEQHKGSLYAENRNDITGSRFIIELPLGNGHLPKHDLVTEENVLPAPSNKIAYQPFKEANKVDKSSKVAAKSAYKIMVVEDEEEIRNYLIEELSSVYKVVAFENGKVAFNELLKESPDLIISDIMMPEMDGIEFCKKVKGNPATSHTPVILLTALSKDEDRAEGIETGADMYLVKPFNSGFLKKSIANILENRRKVYEQLKNGKEEKKHEEEKVKSQDEILVQKMMTIIKEHISDSKLNVEMLADKVGISRVHMYRKLKNLTNQTPLDFIKNIRMKQAAYLLAGKKMNVSEVAYEVGYSNLSHFSNSFKSFYGVSPSEYVQMQGKGK